MGQARRNPVEINLEQRRFTHGSLGPYVLPAHMHVTHVYFCIFTIGCVLGCTDIAFGEVLILSCVTLFYFLFSLPSKEVPNKICFFEILYREKSDGPERLG